VIFFRKIIEFIKEKFENLDQIKRADGLCQEIEIYLGQVRSRYID
jgi:hypothetical protein